MWNTIYATYETLYMQHRKAINETSLMQHGHAIFATLIALMKQYLVIMHNDAHDQVLTAF